MRITKLLHFLTSALLLTLGGLLTLYGVFALTFNERGGSTYVPIAGHRLDAHLVGAVSVAIGLAVIVAAVVAARKARQRSE